MALTLAQQEFVDRPGTEDILCEMDRWIEAFGRQYGINWSISHQIQMPSPNSLDNKRPILTFKAVIAPQIHQVTLSFKPEGYN